MHWVWGVCVTVYAICWTGRIAKEGVLIMIKGLYRNTIIVLNAIYSIALTAFDGKLPFGLYIVGTGLMVLLVIEFIKVVKGDLKR